MRSEREAHEALADDAWRREREAERMRVVRSNNRMPAGTYKPLIGLIVVYAVMAAVWWFWPFDMRGLFR